MGSSAAVASSDGVTLSVHDFGGVGPLLVMAHATGFHGKVFEPLARHLTGSFHCVSFDFRGHGKSTLPEGASLEWRILADDLMSAITHFSPGEPVRAIGHSLGGGCLALASRHHPERFQSVWAFEPILFPFEEEPGSFPLAEGARRRRPIFASRAEAALNYGSKPPLDVLAPEAMAAYVEHGFDDLPDGTVRLACLPEVEAAVFENAMSGTLAAAVETSVPFAVAVGNDGGMPALAARSAVNQAPHLTLVEMELTHFGPLEDPAMVAAAIRGWFE